MTDCDDNFIWNTGNYPDWQVKHWIPLYTHPVKELHLSLQKSKQTGELLAVTYTDDEHRIVEVLWQRPPVKEQDTDCQYCKQGCIRCDARKQLTDEEILRFAQNIFYFDESYSKNLGEDAFRFARAILKRASKK
jgi:hypothetical protein